MAKAAPPRLLCERVQKAVGGGDNSPSELCLDCPDGGGGFRQFGIARGNDALGSTADKI